MQVSSMKMTIRVNSEIEINVIANARDNSIELCEVVRGDLGSPDISWLNADIGITIYDLLNNIKEHMKLNFDVSIEKIILPIGFFIVNVVPRMDHE
ncbi:hypothetical protein M0R19_03560 [Candidatus Pacearchaeota archaeon]|nr:hypothetical protein [Candidatus Pacearchaeota archaeon]